MYIWTCLNASNSEVLALRIHIVNCKRGRGTTSVEQIFFSCSNKISGDNLRQIRDMQKSKDSLSSRRDAMYNHIAVAHRVMRILLKVWIKGSVNVD